MKVQPYLFFNGRCEEAAKFYTDVLGAEITMLMRFSEMPPSEDQGELAPENADKILHASLRAGDTEFFASDGMCSGEQKFEGISLSLAVPTPEEADRVFHALADGGEVQMPLTSTFFSPSFGMVADRFGVSWLVMAEPATAA